MAGEATGLSKAREKENKLQTDLAYARAARQELEQEEDREYAAMLTERLIPLLKEKPELLDLLAPIHETSHCGSNNPHSVLSHKNKEVACLRCALTRFEHGIDIIPEGYRLEVRLNRVHRDWSKDEG